jgi:hypothetical protein
MKAQLSPKEWQQISEYLDDQLSPKEKNRLEERFHLRPDLQEGLEELRHTRLVLRSVPKRRVPHNFTLTPEMVRPRSISRLFPVLSFSSALATILVIVTLAFRLLPAVSSSSAPAMQSLSAPAAPAAPLAAPFNSLAVQGTSVSPPTSGTPEIITWGQQPDTLLSNNAQELGGGAVQPANPAIGSAPLLAPGAIQSQPTQPASLPAPPQAPALAPAAPALSNPPAATNPQAPQRNAQVLTASTPAAPVTFKSASPILGIPARSDRGKIISAATPEPSIAEAASPQPEASQPVSQPFLGWILLEVGLAVIAVVTGLAAYSLWRRSKM